MNSTSQGTIGSSKQGMPDFLCGKVTDLVLKENAETWLYDSYYIGIIIKQDYITDLYADKFVAILLRL